MSEIQSLDPSHQNVTVDNTDDVVKTNRHRRRIASYLKWQSWPPLLLYPPIIPTIIKLCIRYRTTPAIIMAANPLFTYGGLPFDSKSRMQDHFSRVLPYQQLPKQDNLNKRIEIGQSFTSTYGFPVIIKPDTGHRGVGVVLCHNESQLNQQLIKQTWDLMIQAYSDLPCEYGVFFMKKPGDVAGNIVSLTKKIIPSCMVNPVASHNRGAIFVDFMDQVTPQLVHAVNEVVGDKPFYFGRFDVKSPSDQDLQLGKFSIIEINGATAEFIHIYDDRISWYLAMRELKRQWALLFDIASHSQRVHVQTHTWGTFCRRYIQFFKQTKQAEGIFW